MSNGCICCTLRDDLLAEVARLAKEQRFDYLLIESTGISEPMPVAATFSPELSEESAALAELARLDTLATVVDAGAFLADVGRAADLQEIGQAATPEDERTVADLLIDQVECADVIVINKIDRIDAPRLAELRALLARLNPRARLLDAERGQVPLHEILDTKRFDLEQLESAPGWVQALEADQTPETEEYGVSSFVFRAVRPFDPARLWNLFHDPELWAGVLRSKGHFWLATRPAWSWSWSLAGGACDYEPAGTWLAATPKSEWPEAVDPEEAEAEFDPHFGDRLNELVFIGIDLKREALERRLEEALVPAEQCADMRALAALPDPFPPLRDLIG